MNRDIGLPQTILIYALCLPLALVAGYLLSTPLATTSLTFVGLLFCGLSIPLLLKWHHNILIFTWNASLIVFFLPGEPALGTVFAGVSLFLSVINRTMRKGASFISVPSVAAPLIFLGILVALTAYATGGIGGRAFGSDTWGAKRYLGVFGAIIGYFAMTAQAIPVNRGRLAVALYFFSGATMIVSDLAFAAGPAFYFLFIVFPTDYAVSQALSQGELNRLAGLSFGSLAITYALLAVYGIRGILNSRKLWRPVLFIALVAAALFGGFRSSVILLALIFVVLFYFERLFRTILFPALLLSGLLVGVFVVAFVDRMPLSVQRSLSFLPLNVGQQARQDAVGTLDWRFQMWKTLLPDVPKYILLGKGYAFSGTDFTLTTEAVRRGYYSAYEDTLISGNYHQGILTIIIPFGIFGLIGFAWFSWNSLKVLRANYYHGPPELELVNRFLLAFFVAKLFFYVVFYGQFDLDLMSFTGVVGLSVSLNGGVRSSAQIESESAPREDLVLA